MLGILAGGLGLRCWSIGNGIPHTVGVDEPEILRRVVLMMKSGDLNPHFFDYGGLIIYFHLAVASARFATGALAGDPAFASLDRVWDGDFYLWARYATALAGTMLIYVVYRTGLRWGERAALIAAFIVAIQPNLVREAHFALTDTPLALLVAWALLLSLLASETGRPAWFLAAGVAAGLATAVKYNGAIALVMPLAAAATAPPVRIRTLAVLASLAGAAGAFVAAAPYSVLDLPHFLGGFAHLAASYNQPRDPSRVAGLYVTYLRNGFGFGPPGWSRLIGWIALLLSLAGFVLLAAQIAASRQRRPAALAILTFSASYFWMISHQSLVYARYALPLLPMLGLAVGVTVARIGQVRDAARAPLRARLALAAALVVIVPPLWQSAKFDWDRRRTGTEELLARWLERHVAPADPIVMETPVIALPPGFHSDYTPSLALEPLDAYRRAGVRYLVVSSEKFDSGHPGDDPHAAAYRQLFAATQIVAVVSQSREHPGPTLTVLQVPTPDGAPADAGMSR